MKILDWKLLRSMFSNDLPFSLFLLLVLNYFNVDIRIGTKLYSTIVIHENFAMLSCSHNK